MLVAVTGASGFVGRRVVRHLRDAGFSVRAISRTIGAWEEGVETATLPHPSASLDEFERVLNGVDHVVHGAGLTNASAETPESEFMQANAELTARFAEAAARVVAGRFLLMSSIRAVADAGFDGILTPEMPAKPTCAYGRSKRAAELAALARYPDANASRLAILRLPPVYGSGMKGNLARMLHLADTPYPLPFGALRNRRSLLSVEALAAAVVDLLQMVQTRQVYLAGDRDPVSTAEIFTALRAGLGRPGRLLPVPASLLKTAAKLAGRSEDWQGLFAEQICDSSALADDGWRQTEDPRPGLAEAARDFQKSKS
ncbi:NAD-dependent epimerase/dehydratase family protein [Allomesorhizobium camelthorni]|uniref:NAD-dependent epimerase/dehydratase family protein n=1 Tax=Allomesorhizobium camelthorni TaxID=475069 RepID=A0A6G4WBS0_9HYPH|nr:NAD-dependent epimerase/dehydratase family protein [Mesorhizobium camelthorni]NGO52222.1 NAD-dependent epimerase/dehydratase family protein [Mesorhizobium camelthorni]